VTDDGGIVARCPCKRTTVANLLLHVADDSTFGAGRDRKNVPDAQGSLLAAVNKRACMQTLGRDESLLAVLVAIWVTENNASKRSTAKDI